MKKVLLGCLLLTFGLLGRAQITFQFQPGSIDNQTLKAQMEERISRLLTEINAAESAERELALEATHYSGRALSGLNQLWENMHFCCEDDENIQVCVKDQVGFQVRGIPITLKPIDDYYKGSLFRELTISFDPDATITGVRLSLDDQSISQILRHGGTVTDTRCRREILKFVEDFRCYYNEKNLEALKQIYSDDALIITGKVVMTRGKSDMGKGSPKIEYYKQTKPEYIKKLERIFASNKYIDVGFSEISVVSHPVKDGYYGVTLRQNWDTSNYSDEGYLFLLWDFNGDTPKIHVRTWQPTMFEGREFDKKDIFTMADFDL